MRHAVITGTGAHIPPGRVRNEDLVHRRFFKGYGAPLDPAGNVRLVEKFHQITDISERRYVEDGVVASDIGLLAAQQSLDASGLDPEELDQLIVAHNFGDIRELGGRPDFVPSLAARIKHGLGIANPGCVAWDLPFGCPGWLQGVVQAEMAIRHGRAQNALVVGTETLSRVCDPHDRDSLIYADGAGAAVLQLRESPDPVGILACAARSDTLDHARLLWMGPSYDEERPGDDLFLKMNGRKLYEYALTHVPGVVAESLERAGVGLDEVRKLFIHQANAKMDDAILTRMFKAAGAGEPPAGIMPMTISWLGNSSVATLPTLLDLVLRGKLEGHRVDAGDVVVFASVGAGMNINSVVCRWG